MAEAVRDEPPPGAARQPVRRRLERAGVEADRGGARPVSRRARRARPSGCSRRSTSRPGSRPRSASMPKTRGRHGAGVADLGAGGAQAPQARTRSRRSSSRGRCSTPGRGCSSMCATAGEPADERPFNLFRRMIEEMAPESRPSLAALKAAIKRQAFALALDEERALAALPKLAPDMDQRRRGLDAARAVMSARGELTRRAARALSPRRERPRAQRRGGASIERAERTATRAARANAAWLRRTTRSISG